MKKAILFLLGSLSINAYAQFNDSAPWMQELRKNRSEKEMQERMKKPQLFTFKEVQNAFNEYWKTHDKDAKGSGYKPFKRWEYFMENEVDKNGYIPTAQDYFNAWEANNQFQASFVTGTDQSNWQPIGPFTTTGTGSWSTGQARINCVMIDPNNPNTWYVGAPAGGVWKSINAGSTWTTLTDELPQIGVSGIAIDHNNSNIIYIATGDDDAGDSISVGVWKSSDGGQTWNQTGLNPSNSPSRMNDIYIHPSNSNLLWVATNNGVYKSTDAGANWVRTLIGNIKDIKLKPGDPNIIYAASHNSFYKSTDGGNSFETSNSGLPTGSSRLVIDVTPANPNYVYVFRYSNPTVGVYRSTDSGSTFTTRTANVSADFSSGQAWYDLAMGVSDTNAELLFIGCLNIWKSSNGGSSFTKINNWNAPTSPTYTHADIHFIRYYNGNVYAGTDGGVYSSTNNGTSFTNNTFGIQASQMYRVAVSKSNPNKLVAGLQDNGGHAFNNASGQSNNYYGADGMDTAVDPNNENVFYGFIQNGGSLYISENATSLSSSVNGPAEGNWVTPMAINSQGKLYAGYTNLYRLDEVTWTSLGAFGNPLTGGKCDLLEIAPSDDTVMYAVVDNTLKRSTDSGISFVDIQVFSSNVVGVGIHKSDPNTVWVTTSGSGRGVYKTTNGLTDATFTNITSNLPVSGIGNFFTDIVHQGDHPNNPVFLATGVGVYRLDDSSSNWQPFMVNLPNTKVTDLEINEANEVITASTYGRGLWRSAIPVELYENDGSIQYMSQPNNGINCGDAITPEITIKNNGVNVINNVQINYSVDGGAESTLNWTGSLSSTNSTSVVLSELNLSRGEHTINIEIVVANDQNLGNNSMTTSFYVNDNGVVNDVNEFENTSDELITNTLWERGVPTGVLLGSASSGTNVYATKLASNYPNNTKAYLYSQCYDFTTITNPILNFDMAFDLEENWDIAYVEYSIDEGQNWVILGTKNSTPLWYNSDRTSLISEGQDCINCPGKQWTGEGEDIHSSGGTNATMRNYGYNFDVNAANGETDLTDATNIIFRVVFHSDQSVNEEGIVIDNFVINGESLSVDDVEANTFLVYPNPTKGIVYIELEKSYQEVEISILDVSGKLIKKQLLKNKIKHQIDLRGLPKGVYMLNMNADGKQFIHKVILEK